MAEIVHVLPLVAKSPLAYVAFFFFLVCRALLPILRKRRFGFGLNLKDVPESRRAAVILARYRLVSYLTTILAVVLLLPVISDTFSEAWRDTRSKEELLRLLDVRARNVENQANRIMPHVDHPSSGQRNSAPPPANLGSAPETAEEFIREFRVLHEKNKKALHDDDFVVSHEIQNEIDRKLDEHNLGGLYDPKKDARASLSQPEGKPVAPPNPPKPVGAQVFGAQPFGSPVPQPPAAPTSLTAIVQ